MPRAAFGAETSFRGRTFAKLDASAHAFDGLEFDTCVFKECSFPGAALKDQDGYAVRSGLCQVRTTFFL